MLSDLRYRFRALFRRTTMEAEMDDELRAHLEHKVGKYVQSGLPVEEAKRRARLDLGGVEQIKEECRDGWGVRVTEELWQDLRYGLRQLRRNLGFTIVAVLTLAIGIGATTAAFSVVEGVLLKPLPYDPAGRLVRIRERTSKYAYGYLTSVAAADAVDIQGQTEVFQRVTTFTTVSRDLTGIGPPIQVWVSNVSANFFHMFTARTVLGRTFLPTEMEPGNDRVAVISHGLWETMFGGARTALGRNLHLNGETYAIVGVMSKGFKYPSEVQVWVPLSLSPKDMERRSAARFDVVAQLKHRGGLPRAQAALAQLAARLSREYPATDSGCGFQAVSLQDEVVGKVRASLIAFLGASLFLLLIGCGNLASLLLARGAGRRRELVVRAAIGASRSRLFRQMLAESFLLSLAGGGAGLALTACLIHIVKAVNVSVIPRLGAVTLDSSVLFFVAAVSVVTTLVFGTLPALQASQPDLHSGLQAACQGGVFITGEHRIRGQSPAVVFEIAIAFVLLIGAGLFVKSFVRLNSVALGFDPSNVLSGAVFAPSGMWHNPPAQLSFFDRVLQRVTAEKAFDGAALVNIPPLAGGFILASWAPLNQPEPGAAKLPPADLQIVSADYFPLLGIRLIKGRLFSVDDRQGTPAVAVINSAMAREYWLSENPMGARIRIKKLPGGSSPTCTIIGVVDDTRYVSPLRPPEPEIYVAFSQFPIPIMSVLARSRTNPSKLIGILRGQVAAVAKDEPVADLATLEERLSTTAAAPQFHSLVFGTFAVFGLLLACVGIYGVLAYSVAQRTHEIGIRMALGAQKGDVLRMMLRQGLMMTLGGLVVGLTASLALTRFLSGLLYGVRPTDSLTFVTVSLILTVVSLLACYIPARRATKVDPMIALRYE